MLQQRGYYTINLGSGKKVPVRFCTWSFKRFCELNGNLTISQLEKELSHGMTLTSFVSLLLCAAEYVCIKEKKEFSYSDMDASDWIDEMGGIAGGAFMVMLAVMVDSFSDSGSVPDKEKKILEKAEN